MPILESKVGVYSELGVKICISVYCLVMFELDYSSRDIKNFDSGEEGGGGIICSREGSGGKGGGIVCFGEGSGGKGGGEWECLSPCPPPLIWNLYR